MKTQKLTRQVITNHSVQSATAVLPYVLAMLVDWYEVLVVRVRHIYHSRVGTLDGYTVNSVRYVCAHIQ